MRSAYLTAAILLLLSHPAAQEPAATAEGIDAFFRGEYGRAAEILTEAADTPGRPDETAAFLLATMYEDGRGVPADPVRADESSRTRASPHPPRRCRVRRSVRPDRKADSADCPDRDRRDQSRWIVRVFRVVRGPLRKSSPPVPRRPRPI